MDVEWVDCEYVSVCTVCVCVCVCVDTSNLIIDSSNNGGPDSHAKSDSSDESIDEERVTES